MRRSGEREKGRCLPWSKEEEGGIYFLNETSACGKLSKMFVLLVEETGVSGENHESAASHWQTLSYNVLSSTPRLERGSNSQL